VSTANGRLPWSTKCQVTLVLNFDPLITGGTSTVAVGAEPGPGKPNHDLPAHRCLQNNGEQHSKITFNSNVFSYAYARL